MAQVREFIDRAPQCLLFAGCDEPRGSVGWGTSKAFRRGCEVMAGAGTPDHSLVHEKRHPSPA